MKKILCLIDSLNSGGAQRQLVGLADLLCKNGYDVEFMWYHPIGFYKPFLDENHIPYINVKANNKLTKLWKVYREIQRFNPDTIIAYLGGPSKISCILKMLGLKAKVIVSERSVVKRITRSHKLKYFLYRWSDHVVCNGLEQTDFIKREFSFLKEKTVTIRNFVDINYFVPSKVKEEHSNIRILAVGRISKEKNIERFMKAIENVIEQGTDISVKWFGGTSAGQLDYKEKIEKNYHCYKFQNKFVFYPPSHTILEEYQKCDVFCLPSLFEGFPNVICEALSCGKPVLCSDVDDNPYLVADKINGFLFNPLDVDDMAAKIVKFCELSIEERIEMGKRSRQMAIEKLSGNNFVQKYIELIES